MKTRKLDEGEFLRERKEVLLQWHTGAQVDLEEAIAYHQSLPSHKIALNKMRYGKENEEIYATTGMGKATLEEQIELLQYIENEGQADVLAISPDSLTRQNDYAGAQRGLEESIKSGRSMLNGLPVVCVGVPGIRKIIESVNCPVQPRYGAADARLCDEILFAGGCTGSAPDVFMDFWQHSASISLEKVYRTHRYVCRLMGYYTEHGVPISSSAQGFYGAGLPPSLQTAAIILSHLLQAEQGVKHMSSAITCHGSLVQDVACARVRKALLNEYLKKFGYNDIEIFGSASFNLMQYPIEIGANLAVVFMNTLMAKLCGAQMSDIRTVAEAKAIPTKQDIAFTFRAAKFIQNLLQKQPIFVDEAAVEIEADMHRKEAACILDKVLEFGDGDILRGAEKAIKAGVLDNPYAANRAAAGQVAALRDSEGAIRYLDTGNLPFTPEIRNFNKEKIAQREQKYGRKISYDTIIEDLLAVSKGYLVQ